MLSPRAGEGDIFAGTPAPTKHPDGSVPTRLSSALRRMAVGNALLCLNRGNRARKMSTCKPTDLSTNSSYAP